MTPKSVEEIRTKKYTKLSQRRNLSRYRETFSRAISSAVMRNSQLPNVYTLSYSVNITVKHVQEEVIIEDEI